MRQRIAENLFYLAVLILPWQTSVIFNTLTISGDPTEYGKLSIYAVELLIVIVFLLRGRRNADQRVREIWKALYVFLAVGFFSLTFASVSSIGWFQLLHVLSASLLFFLVTDERTNLKRLGIFFLVGLLLPIAFGWFQVLSGASPSSTILGISAHDAEIMGTAVVETNSGRMMRAYGMFPHPNIFGGYLAIGIIILAWLTRFVRSRRELWAALTAAALLGASLITTFSRGAWLGTTLALSLIILLMLFARKAPPSRALPIATIGLLSILITLGVFNNEVLARFNPELRIEAISVEERASQYSTFSAVFGQDPILGVGPGGYVFALERLDPGNEAWSYQPIHNAPLLILAELGLFGFLFLIWWVYKIDRISHAIRRRANGMFALSIGIALLIISLFDHYPWSLWPGLALSALALGLMLQWARDAA